MHSHVRLDLELKDHEGSTALWLALQYITVSADNSVNPFEDEAPVENGTSFDENSFAAQLIQRGSNPDAPDISTGTVKDTQDCCFHLIAAFAPFITCSHLSSLSFPLLTPSRKLPPAESSNGRQ